MVKYKYIDWICIGAAVLAILLTLLLMFGEQLRLPKGKAELLRKIKGMSKRIDDTNRLVYTVENDSIIVLSCRGHYED